MEQDVYVRNTHVSNIHIYTHIYIYIYIDNFPFSPQVWGERSEPQIQCIALLRLQGWSRAIVVGEAIKKQYSGREASTYTVKTVWLF